MAMMTYKAFCADVNENPILAQSDETVQTAVYDWFKYRYIGFEDTDKFLDILQRNVAINYPMYLQKLRIEPGVSTYDWLVSDYRERQLKTKGETANTQTRGQDITNVSEDVTNSSATTYNTGTTNIRTGGQTDTHTGTDTTTDTGTSEHAKTGTDTQTHTGTVSEETVAGLHTTTDAPHVQRVTSEDGGDSAWSGDTQISAQLPMSKSYTTFIEPDEDSTDKQYYKKAYQHLPSGGLDWTTATTQGQSGHREYHDTDHKTTESYVYGDGVAGDINTTQGDKNNPDTHETTYNESNATEYGSKDTETRDLASQTAHDTTDTLTYNSVTDTGTHTGTDTTSGTNARTQATTNTYGNVENTGTDSRTDREQVTGRNEDPATLLFKATAFIEQSSAFAWFKEQIDSCFYPGYYTEDEERSAFI